MADQKHGPNKGGEYSPEFLANIFKPGQSGNPNGRPKRPSLESLVRTILDEEIEVKGQRMSKREAWAARLVKETMRGNPQIEKELLKREWPEVTRHELSGPGGEPIALEDARGRLAGKLSRLAASLSGDEVPTEPRPNGSGDPRA